MYRVRFQCIAIYDEWRSYSNGCRREGLTPAATTAVQIAKPIDYNEFFVSVFT